MKKIAVLVVLMVASSPALADGYYVGGYLGLAAVDSTNLNVPGPGSPITFSTEPGINAGVMIGTSISDNLRVEGEIVYSSAGGQRIGGTSIDGNITALSMGTNLIYDFSGDRMRPYVGGGLAAIMVDASGLRVSGVPIFEGAPVTGGLQLIMGVSIPLESVTLFADYRGLISARVELAEAVTGTRVSMDNYFRNSLMFGFRSEF